MCFMRRHSKPPEERQVLLSRIWQVRSWQFKTREDQEVPWHVRVFTRIRGALLRRTLDRIFIRRNRSTHSGHTWNTWNTREDFLELSEPTLDTAEVELEKALLKKCVLK